MTDEDLAQINGDRKALAGIIQKRYNVAKKVADKQIDTWANTLKV